MSPSAVSKKTDRSVVEEPTGGGLRGLRWGIKESFISYVIGMPDGVMSVTDGAVADSRGFLFPVRDASAFDPRTGSGILRFGGDVRLRAHGGMLQVRIADPELTVDGYGPRLSIVDAGGGRLTIAHLGTPAAAAGGGLEIPAFLSTDGVPYFNDVYPDGTPLDPLVVRGI